VTSLFEPFTLPCGATLKNRVLLAPLTNKQSNLDGSLGDAELAWLERRAQGGFSAITTCAAHVSRDGQGWPGELGFFDDTLLPGLSRLAGAINGHGALGIVQLFHGGARSPEGLIGERPWSASESTDDPANPRAATEADIDRVIADFRAGAVRAHAAGFGGVEIHGAHGYLLCQFLSATQNRRGDRWGGTEGRPRLLRTVVAEVRAALPPDFVVGVRISPEDFGNARGLDLDESLALASTLADDGVDYVHVSLWDVARNTTKRPDQHPIPLFREALRGHGPKGSPALVVAGKIWTRDDAERCLAQGADLVALGRSAIANPDWPTRAADPTWAPVLPPVPPAVLLDGAVSPGFVEYLRAFKGFVAP
jgi:2,4-dienoyl-CoA reductase-like NADH-dependent reductase (Old Yellow Enzyme family)